jgi:hypothetical protein
MWLNRARDHYLSSIMKAMATAPTRDFLSENIDEDFQARARIFGHYGH